MSFVRPVVVVDIVFSYVGAEHVGLKARQGSTLWGATMLSAAESLLQSTGGAWWPADRIEVERNREFIRSSLNDDEFTKAWKQGGAMTIDQAISFASNES